MADPEWFEAKRYGLGAGLPIAWQGWALVIGYAAVAVAAAHWLGDSPLALGGILVPVTALLILIMARTTRGGWHWRWGKDD